MAKISETGHAKNVANFSDLITICKGFGNRYNPARKDFALETATAQLQAAEQLQKNLNNVVGARITTVAQKDEVFKPMSKRITRAVSSFKSCAPLPGELSNAQTIAKLIKGESNKKGGKAIEQPQNPEAPKNGHSTSRMSMDSRVENLNRLIEVFASSGVYNFNEADLSLQGLYAFSAELKAKSDLVTVAERAEGEARTQRNKALYTPKTGLVAVGNGIRDYVKGVFGTDSPEYKAVLRITFRIPDDV
jgi:hypothetical protein